MGWDVRRAYPLPESGEVPSVTDPFHEQRRLLRGTTSPVIFDIGAHVGRVVQRYAELVPGARLYAFEPFPGSYEQLVAVATRTPNVTPFKMALGAYSGRGVLHVNRSTATNSLLPTDPRARETWNGTDVTETVGKIEVEVRRLDDFLAERTELGRIDVLKLDAQGSEMDIFHGGATALRSGRIGMVYAEIIVGLSYVGQSHWLKNFEWLTDAGYDVHNVYNLCHNNDGGLNQLDALFVRRT